MTDNGSPFDEDGEWVTSISDGDQDETADDQLVRGMNLAKTSDPPSTENTGEGPRLKLREEVNLLLDQPVREPSQTAPQPRFPRALQP